MYEIFEQLLQKHGVSTYKVAKDTGIAQSVFSSWKNGISTPKSDKIEKLANYFNVPVEYLMYGKERETDEPYYINDDAREMAQFMFENPEYKVLFDASRKVSADDIETVKAILDKFRSQD